MSERFRHKDGSSCNAGPPTCQRAHMLDMRQFGPPTVPMPPTELDLCREHIARLTNELTALRIERDYAVKQIGDYLQVVTDDLVAVRKLLPTDEELAALAATNRWLMRNGPCGEYGPNDYPEHAAASDYLDRLLAGAK